MLAGLHHDEGCRAQKQDTAHRIHPNTPAASLGQVKARVVQHGQRHDGVAIGHSDVLAVDGGGSGQQLGSALLTGAALASLDNELDGVREENVTLIGGNLN